MATNKTSVRAVRLDNEVLKIINEKKIDLRELIEDYVNGKTYLLTHDELTELLDYADDFMKGATKDQIPSLKKLIYALCDIRLQIEVKSEPANRNVPLSSGAREKARERRNVLLKLMKDKNITFDELARHMNKSESSLAGYFSGCTMKFFDEAKNALFEIAKKKQPGEPITKQHKEQNIIPPTLDMVRAYCRNRKSTVSATQFYDWYQSKDWMVGKNKMKDWQAAVRTWEERDKNRQ